VSRSVLPRFKALVVAEDPREPFDQAVKRRQENERAFRRQVEQYLENLLTTIATDPTGPSGIGSLPVGAAVGDLIYGSAIDTWSRKAIGSAGYWLRAGTTPDWTAPAALTKSDDTNVTLTLGGSASTALLNAASLTLGWVGTLGPTRGGTGVASLAAGAIEYGAGTGAHAPLVLGTTGYWLGAGASAPQYNAPAALTKSDDTNVTLTLGGSAASALLNAASLTLGWTGQLAVARGGTGLGSFTAHAVLTGGSAGTALGFVAPSTAKKVLASDGTDWASTAIDFTYIGSTLAYSQLPTGGGTWANGGTLSITGGVTTVAGLTSSALITAQLGPASRAGSR
jgi:hypothetical protein